MGIVKPQLCCDADLDKLRIGKSGIMVFPKIDGVRAINLTGRLTGRSLKEHANKFTTRIFSHQEFLGFDGEMAMGSITSDSLCRDTTSALSSINGEPALTWNIFDYLSPGFIELPYMQRYLAAKYGIMRLDAPWLRIIPFEMCHAVTEVEAVYDRCLSQGYEGVVLRDPDGMHKDGRATVREGAYLRIKPSSDKEATVVSLVEALENQNEAKINELGHTERSSHKENKVGKRMVGMLQCEDVATGQLIDVGAGKMDHGERAYYWANPDKIIGKIIKYRSMDKGVKDKPRFARYICMRSLEDM